MEIGLDFPHTCLSIVHQLMELWGGLGVSNKCSYVKIKMTRIWRVFGKGADHLKVRLASENGDVDC